MTHPLDGIEAKLARADLHFKAIEEEVRPITAADPDRIPGEFNDETGTYFFRANRDSRSEDWLSPVIGDFVHNLRSALDYIVWTLTTDAVRASPKANKIEFPIFIDPTSYRSFRPDKLCGVSDEAARVIDLLQPFNGPDGRRDLVDAATQPLWHLFQLDKWDKHRALNLTEHLGRAWVDFEYEGVVHRQPAESGFHWFKRGAVFAEVETIDMPRDVKVYLRATYDVSFDRDGPTSVAAEPVLKTLDDIRSEVRDRVLPSLLEYLPSQ